MTPEQFIATWKNNALTERAGAQGHFDDLCELLGVDKPRDPENYCFERGAKKAGGGADAKQGWADVWKRNHFGWENKKPGRDLDAALKQLTDYALQLDNPPLLVVCDRERIVIHTAFTGYPDEPREIRIDELIEPEKRQLLKWVFTDPEKLRPEKSTAAITAEAAGQFAQLAAAMRERGAFADNCGEKVAHFLVQCLFCMFAEDEQLLPAGVFTSLLANAGNDAGKAARRIEKLFTAMQKKGGDYGDHDIPWFNGGLFKTIDVPALSADDLKALHRAAADMDWRAIDPTIFGTLFERGLDPAARAPLGAHYTDTGTIAKLIDPLVREPLAAEWEEAKTEIVAKPKKAKATYQGFLLRLNHFRVLDPACGSGNFLYLALKALRDIEKRAHVDALELGLQAPMNMETGPHNILGLEINEFAAELARVTVWIGDIQWCRQNGYPHAINPILKPLDGIEHRDALLSFSSPDKGRPGGVTEADWPTADVVVGNPPFLGDKVMRSELGAEYVETLRKTYDGRVPGGADLVTYWFEKARAQIEAGQLKAAGLVATQSIRAGANRKVLERIVATTRIFEAWSDEAWVNDGAAVRVSLVGFGTIYPTDRGSRLNSLEVQSIHADLTAVEGLNLTTAIPLSENQGVAFQGPVKVGSFDIPGPLARQWLTLPNPNGRSSAEVLRPWANGQDLAKRPSDTWIIDFGTDMLEADAVLFEMPIAHVMEHVRPMREAGNRESRKRYWWRHGETVPAYRKATTALSRYLSTPRVSKHRYFVWLPKAVLPDSRLYAICRDDDATFGILSSRPHEVWSLANASMHGVGNDPTYNAKSCFETFPFPPNLTPRDTAPRDCQASPPCLAEQIVAENIAAAARRLNELRENWLNPPEWVDWVITPEEEKAGFPKRPVAKPGHEADLKKRTLTNLYNQRPAWLDLAHKELDKAVAAAYGWTDYAPETPDEEILRRLLALNLERSY
ncbi:MAG: class I SAM-dependent DNA methyltransferase [Propionivibrio sp.]|uniref:class I SAM-dependent DNA methyltransferase n=1 Tax=Propionivibrio sp. TaxID=2212460 RepID=UPI001B518CA0|nr:DNA methyltransferase [Propionivibrio sp.]MBP7204211.1 class I SAM-dependent DNA methyltransferase [Propionivibrio sp.]